MLDKKTLYNSDIIMAYRGSSPCREDGLYAVLRHFDLTYKDYRILLLEADESPKFNWEKLADKKIQYLFIHNNDPFPKSLLYNIGAKIASSEIIVFTDTDCIADPESLTSSINELMTLDNYDVFSPYEEMIDISGELKKRFMEHPEYSLLKGINQHALKQDCRVLYKRNTGGVSVLKRKEFIQVGGMNTKFIGWGGEDSELFYRSRRLGLRWYSLRVPLFHLNHKSLNRPEWEVGITHEGRANGVQANLSDTMPIEELQTLSNQLNQFFQSS